MAKCKVLRPCTFLQEQVVSCSDAKTWSAVCRKGSNAKLHNDCGIIVVYKLRSHALHDAVRSCHYHMRRPLFHVLIKSVYYFFDSKQCQELANYL